jgi:arylsulfatase A-like enzyme
MSEDGRAEAADGTEPYAGFGGKVGRVYATSEGWWPARPTPPADAPNVVVMLADDLGYADLGCYGSEIDTPNLDALAQSGFQLTDFHVTPMCSPTRAALLTGLNAHDAGVGHVAHSDAGFPGYAMELTDRAATLAEIFRDNGYATLMVGKWHLAKDSNVGASGPKHSWPIQRGFDRFYGFLDAFTNFHHPHRLVEDNHLVEVDRYPDGYYFTDDITTRAIRMVHEVKASNPAQPFFLYFAHGAVHAPLQAKPDDIQKYADTYRAGWDRVRDARWERQRALGVVPDNAELPPRNSEPMHDVKAWDDLSPREQELFARYMAVFAGMVDNVDQNFGRLRDALDEMGELDNTIILFLSDNGGSREGEANGTSQYFRTLTNQVVDGAGDDAELDIDHARLDLIGGPQTLAHYPRGWAMVSSAPYRLYKINTHLGGHSVPFLLSWPRRFGSEHQRRDQFAYVTDILPTLLDLVGIERPATRNGLALKPLAGTSFVPVLDDPSAASQHTEQVMEMIGHRGFYRDGWEIVTMHLPRTPFGDHEWELYDLRNDPTELRNLAAEMPEKVAELAAAWEEAAWRYQIFPLDEGTGLRFVQRPPGDEVYTRPVTIYRETPSLERYRSYVLVFQRSFHVAMRIDHRVGADGMLVAHGDQGGGYAVCIEDGRLTYIHNGFGVMTEVRAADQLAAGAHEVVLDVVNPGKLVWNVRLLVDGTEVAAQGGLRSFVGMAPFEGIDVGIDRRSPVSWRLYEQHGPFPYAGEIRSVTYTPGELAPDHGARWLDVLREMGVKYE